MNFLHRVVWLSRRNFLRGSLWNVAAVFLVAVSSLVSFGYFLYRLAPNPSFGLKHAEALPVAEWLLGALLVTSFVALLAVFHLVNRVRYHEIGVLRGIGAKRRFVFLMILAEIQFIALTGVAVAILLGIVSASVWDGVTARLFLVPDGFTGVLRVAGAGFFALCATSVGAVLAALWPAFVITRVEPYVAIRNRE